MAENNQISIRAFAKIIKVSDAAVRKAIKQGKFTLGYDELTKTIDPKKAMKNPWVEQQGTGKAKPGISKAAAMKKGFEAFDNGDKDDYEEAADQQQQIIDEGLKDGTLSQSIKVTSTLKYSEAMRRREVIALALDKIKLEEATGTMVHREKVDRAFHVIATELKKALLNMPPKVVRVIMKAQKEVNGIAILEGAINEVLKDFGQLKPDTFR